MNDDHGVASDTATTAGMGGSNGNRPATVSTAPPEVPELTARMVNEFVYCPRLFYYEFVEGVFAHNADTLRGAHGHRRVDTGTGKLPPPAAPGGNRSGAEPKVADRQMGEAKSETREAEAKTKSSEAEAGTESNEEPLAAARARGEVIHSRSVWLGSARWGVNAKLDLVETRTAAGQNGTSRVTAVPVDYKKGAPREGEDGLTLWDADRVQLGLQMLILREHGYDCPEGVIYYQETKQRVRLPWTTELEVWIERTLRQAQACAASPVIPPPLVDSPKCPRCSLAPVCLPDETNLLATATATGTTEHHHNHGAVHLPVDRAGGGLPVDEYAPPPRPVASVSSSVPVRRLMASRDERRPLYLNTPGLWVGVKSERLIVKERDQELDAVRLGDVSHLALFGNIQLSTQAVQRLCELEVPITYFSMGGWFYGLTHGHGLKNIFTRVAQFRRADDPAGSLALAARFVHGKIRNGRTLLMRNHVEAPERPLLRLRQAAADVLGAGSREELLGMEGAAAAAYFEHFAGMIKVGRDEENPGGAATTDARVADGGTAPAPSFRFDFHGRNRRPPRDPVNALLSLAYSLLAKDCTLAALAVGFDPYLGFYHQPRHGRPALALDLMEEFRPLVAESAVLYALNNRVLDPGDFLRAGDHAANLTPAGRRKFFDAYEKRMSATLRHPVFDYAVSYRRALELQARLLARTLTGEIPEYRPLLTR